MITIMTQHTLDFQNKTQVLLSSEHQPWIHLGWEQLTGYVYTQYQPSKKITAATQTTIYFKFSEPKVGQFSDGHLELLLDST
jgi:hypothetical protein